ncbi:glycoside hydrolase family 114 protein, partial [Piromyces sp. E2]
MKFILPITLVASTLLSNVKADIWHPKPGLTWDYLLGAKEKIIQKSDKDVVTFDLELAKKMVPIFHNRDGKPDKQKFIDAGLVLEGGDGWGNKPLNIKNKKKLQPLLRDRFRRAYQYGCDAVEVDCIDVYNYTEKISRDDVLVFAKWLAETAHEENISIGLKNVATISEKLQPYFDFAVVESCAKSPNVCDYYKAFTNNNKAVFIVHYGDLGWGLSGSSFKTLKKEQGNRGFTCVLSAKQNLNTHSINYNCDTGAEI